MQKWVSFVAFSAVMTLSFVLYTSNNFTTTKNGTSCVCSNTTEYITEIVTQNVTVFVNYTAPDIIEKPKEKLPLPPLESVWKNEGYLVGVTLIKNHAQYIREWVIYHLLVGLDKIIIYDDSSTDDTEEVVQPFVKIGAVEYIKIKDINDPERVAQRYKDITEDLNGCVTNMGRGGIHPQAPCQVGAFNDAFARHKGRGNWTWLMVFDVDEFYVPVSSDNLKGVYKKLENYGAIQAIMKVFGGAPHVLRPIGLQTKSYTQRPPIGYSGNGVYDQQNRQIKTINNMNKVSHIGIHGGDGNPYLYVEKINEHVQIIHYQWRSLEESYMKLDLNKNDYYLFTADKYRFWNKENDTSMAELSDKLRVEEYVNEFGGSF